MVFAGLGSHSGAYLAGEYLTTHDIPAFAGLLGFTRRISRILLPWTADNEHSGLSIPYIDYARGDGVAIGPRQARTWEPVVIDENTPWVVHYRGLWGNDTRDPLGGERGPAGPRYERSATVRASWGDPVGWAGLRKVPSDAVVAADAVQTRLAQLGTGVEGVDAQIEKRQTALRAAVAGGEQVSATDEAELASLAAQRIALRDHQLLLAERLDRPASVAGPHDHLRHRRVPLPTETRGRRRVLAVWSAVSTSVVLVVFMIILVSPGWEVDAIAVETVIVFFALEALARKQLFRFAVLIVAILVVGALLLSLSGVLVADWGLVVGLPLGLAAAALLFLNIRELLRDRTRDRHRSRHRSRRRRAARPAIRHETAPRRGAGDHLVSEDEPSGCQHRDRSGADGPAVRVRHHVGWGRPLGRTAVGSGTDRDRPDRHRPHA